MGYLGGDTPELDEEMDHRVGAATPEDVRPLRPGDPVNPKPWPMLLDPVLHEEAVSAGDYRAALSTVRPSYRFAQFEFWWEHGHLSLDQMRDLLTHLWQIAGGRDDQRRALRLFRSAGFVTDAPEEWARLSDPLEVWRGTNHLRPKGLSWTLDRDRAVWFARRFPSLHTAAYLVHGRILKRHVFALCLTDEAEIVANPAKLRVLEVSDALASEHDAAYQRVAERTERYNEALYAAADAMIEVAERSSQELGRLLCGPA